MTKEEEEAQNKRMIAGGWRQISNGVWSIDLPRDPIWQRIGETWAKVSAIEKAEREDLTAIQFDTSGLLALIGATIVSIIVFGGLVL